MTLRPLGSALLAVTAIALAGCNENAASPAASAGDKDTMRRAQVKFAECMREQGVDMPDPTEVGKSTFKVGGDSGILPEEFESAAKACEKYRKDLRPQLSEEEQAEFKEKALAHARCMRDHGIDFPDPTFSAEGGAQVRLGGRGKLDPEDPEFQAAEEACGDLMGKRTSKAATP